MVDKKKCKPQFVNKKKEEIEELLYLGLQKQPFYNYINTIKRRRNRENNESRSTR